MKKRTKRTPLPAGTLVTGYNTKYELWVVSACKGHVWELMDEAQKVDFTETGYAQSARCLNCGTPPTRPICITNWTQASPEHIRRARMLMIKNIKRLRQIARSLQDE